MSWDRVKAADAASGATIPWVTYEAEDANTNGTILGPDYVGHTPAREASGRRCVRLARPGDYLEFHAKADAQGIVVRYCIPGQPHASEADATLSLYVNGDLKSKLPLTFKYSHQYGKYPFTKNPADGTPRHFWDEVRLMPGPIHAGDVLRFQKDEEKAADEYLIDLVDLESVPPPLEAPPDALSVIDFGADSTGRSDTQAAFTAAIAAGRSQHKTVWIPRGQYLVQRAIQVSDVSLCGAGMWYSELIGGSDSAPDKRVAVIGAGSNVKLSDFAIRGNLNYRNDDEPNDGLGGTFGTGSSIRNIWAEHTKTGAWLINSDGLQVEGCRFRDTMADGINLCVGMRNTLVRNCTARGNGDDCFAMWPATYRKAIYSPGFNQFVNCTAQCPYLAQGFSVYGGDGNRVDHCAAIDIPYGAGLFASTTFPTEVGFAGITSFTSNRIVRAGGDDGAIGLVANRVDLTGLRFDDIDVLDSIRDGIRITSINGRILNDLRFDHVQVLNTGLGGEGSGIAINSAAIGAATLSAVNIVHPGTTTEPNSASGFHLFVVQDTATTRASPLP